MSDSLIGEVPAEWSVLTLGEACALGGGDIQTGPFGSQLHASDYVEAGVPSIMPVNIGDNRVLEEGIARIRESDAHRLARHRVQAGDVVYSRRGDVERRALITDREAGWLCGTGCLRVRFGPGHVDPRYASYYLGHPDVRAWIVRHAQGATMPNLNTSILSALPFVTPPADKQRRIAGVLGALDDKIELNRRTAVTLEAAVRQLYLSLVADSENSHRESIYNVADVVYGAPFASGLFNTAGDGLPLIRIRDLATERPQVWTTERHPKGRLAEPGDIVVGMDGEFRAYVWAGEAAWLNQRVCTFIPKPGFSPAFVLQSIAAPLADVEATESATTVIHLGKADIDRFEIPLPPAAGLARFDAAGQPLLDRSVAARREARTLAALRDALLPRLLSGELEVPA